MGTLSNKVDRLDWQVPIANPNGTPTAEFQRKWVQQAKTNASIPDLTTAAAVSAVIDLLSSTVGALLVRGATQWGELAPSADGKVLRDKGAGNAPIWDTISDILDTIANTRGAVLYRGAAGWSALPPSAAGKVLTDGGAGADPSWQTGSGGGAASVKDDGTTLYIAASDADGGMVLDGAGNPVWVPEVLPASAIPSLDASQIGSGTFAAARIPNLDASKVTTGNLDLARAPALNGTRVFTLLGAAYNTHVSGTATIDMMGLGGTLVITPTKTGRVRVRLSGWLSVNTASISDQGVRLYYGTGTAPATHAAATGTLATPDYLFFAGAAFQKTFTLIETEITGLTLGTTYWVDVGCYSDGTTVMNVRWNSAIVEEF